MSLSGEIDLDRTAGKIISRALRKIGVLGQGFTASDDEMTNGIDVLNELMQTWSTDGPNLWTPATQTVTLVSGTQTYTLGPRPRLVMNARRVDNGTEAIPLTPWEQQDWDRFIYKDNEGLPLRYLVQKLRTDTTLTFWPKPSFTSGTYTVNVGYERVWEIVTSAAETVDIPQEFAETVLMCLAARLIEDYRLPDDDNTRRIASRASTLYNQAMAFDRTGEIAFRVVR